MLFTKDNIKHSTGPTANIRSINATDLRNYLDNHYKSGRIVVAGAGGVCHEDLVKLAECNLGQLSECRFRVKKGIIPTAGEFQTTLIQEKFLD